MHECGPGRDGEHFFGKPVVATFRMGGVEFKLGTVHPTGPAKQGRRRTNLAKVIETFMTPHSVSILACDGNLREENWYDDNWFWSWGGWNCGTEFWNWNWNHAVRVPFRVHRGREPDQWKGSVSLSWASYPTWAS